MENAKKAALKIIENTQVEGSGEKMKSSILANIEQSSFEDEQSKKTILSVIEEVLEVNDAVETKNMIIEIVSAI